MGLESFTIYLLNFEKVLLDFQLLLTFPKIKSNKLNIF